MYPGAESRHLRYIESSPGFIYNTRHCCKIALKETTHLFIQRQSVLKYIRYL